jgi:hypothetical protein
MEIMSLDLTAAAQSNLLGFPVLALLVFVPPVIAGDILFQKNIFYCILKFCENKIKTNPWISIPLAFSVLANWIWLIAKH